MNFRIFGNEKAPTLLLIPGLGVSYEIFLPLIRLTEDKFRIIAAEVDGFTLGKHTRFTSVEDQAASQASLDYLPECTCTSLRWHEPRSTARRSSGRSSKTNN